MSTFLRHHLLLFLTFIFNSAIAGNNLIFSGDAVIIVSDRDKLNNTAFNASLQDFIIDFYNTFAIAPLTFDPKGYTPCSIGPSSVSAIYVGLFASNVYPISLLPEQNIHSCYNGKESHCVRVVYDSHLNIYSMIAMSNDTLGAIYALYTISELLFGIDPLYRFSGVSGFDLSDNGYLLLPNGTNLAYVFPSPSFEYRAIFTNDEDLLGGFGADPYGQSVFSGTVLMWLFESLLRLKGNMMQIGTITYPDEISLKLANKRGIYIQAASHFNVLSSNTKQFPSQMKDEWEWNRYPMTPKFVWNASIQAILNTMDNDDVIWSVGYRGLWDYAAPCPNCTEQQKGHMVSQVIANMTEWLPVDSKMMTFMWGEGIAQLSKGYLKIPSTVSIILTDNGNGFINDVDQYGNIAEGIYIHTAMYNGQSNQLTEMTSPVRFGQQIGKFTTKAKKTKYAIINTSDLKPVLLSTSAVFCYLYNPNDCGNDYILKWCAKRYLLKHQNAFDDSNYYIAKQIALLYERYYNISYVARGISDNNISNTIIDNANAFIKGIQNNNVFKIVTQMGWRMQSNQTMQYITDLYKDTIAFNTTDLTVESVALFEDHVLLQQSYHYFGQLAVNNIYYAAVHYPSDASLDYVVAALDNMQNIFKATRKSEQHNNWRGLHYNARLSDFQRARSYVKRLHGLVENGDSCELPVRPFKYYAHTWYQLPHKVNYPLFYYNESYHMNTFVRVFCINTGNQINNNNITNCCINNANGGTFINTNGCNAIIQLNVLRWDICKYVRYTLDRSVPNINSAYVMQNKNVLNITKSVMLQARCQYFDDKLDPQVTTANFMLASFL
eukprot:34228_1